MKKLIAFLLCGMLATTACSCGIFNGVEYADTPETKSTFSAYTPDKENTTAGNSATYGTYPVNDVTPKETQETSSTTKSTERNNVYRPSQTTPKPTENKTPTTQSTTAPQQSSNNDISLYVPVITATLNKQDNYCDGSGFLYDIDNDGTQELVMLAIDKRYNGETMPAYCYSVYDIENGRAVAKIDNELLCYDIAGPGGNFSVANYSGKTVLVLEYDNGETGMDAHRTTIHTIFDTSSYNKIAESTMDYQIVSNGKNREKTTLNGSECTSGEYDNFINSINLIKTAEMYSNQGSDGSMTIRGLLNHVKS